jgi:thymidylate kinase/uncharacterized protein (DUF1330 family)
MEKRHVGLVVVEGADATGKTTLSDGLAKMYDGQVIHLTYNKEVAGRMFDYQTEGLLEAIQLSNERLVIIERHWISECMYANTFRGGSPWPLMGRMMDRVIMKHGGVYVICLPTTIRAGVDFHKKNLDSDHPYEDEKFHELLFRYDRLYGGCHSSSKFPETDYGTWITLHGGLINRTQGDIMAYCITRQGVALDLFCFTVAEAVNTRRLLQYKPALDPNDHNVLGHRFGAEFLIIGEEVNNKGMPYNWPFYEYGNSSLWFAEALQAANVDETRLMWTNATGPDGYKSKHIPALVKDGLRPITLGRKAETITRTLLDNHHIKADIITIEHPEHARRFANGEAYLEQLKAIFG